MTQNLRAWAALCVGLVVVCAPTFAHHGTSAYDMTKPITLRGTITRFEMVNPHSMVYFDVKDDKGNVVHWVAESLPPGRAIRAGWKHDSLKPGDEVSVTLNPSKNGAPVGFLQKIVLPNGNELTIKAPE